jgi:predicted RNA binding protein YcfA (HicA-like mRNA interferase family)
MTLAKEFYMGVKYAVQELERAGFTKKARQKDKMMNLLFRQILELVKTFEDQHHSGSTAAYVIPTLNTLLKHRPLVSYEGKREEFNEPCPGMLQHRGISSIFLDEKTGVFEYIDGYVFKDKNGWSFTSSRSSHRYFRRFPQDPQPRRLSSRWQLVVRWWELGKKFVFRMMPKK